MRLVRFQRLRRSDFVPRLTYASVEGMFLELVDASPVRRHASCLDSPLTCNAFTAWSARPMLETRFRCIVQGCTRREVDVCADVRGHPVGDMGRQAQESVGYRDLHSQPSAGYICLHSVCVIRRPRLQTKCLPTPISLHAMSCTKRSPCMTLLRQS